jgi:transposase
MSGLSIASYFPFTRVKVVQQNVHLDLPLPGTLIHLQPDRRYHPICRQCGTPGVVHLQGLRRIVRDLNLGPAQTFLQVEYRRIRCPHCRQTCAEHLDFLEPHKRLTQRLARYVYELCKIMTVLDVARHLDLDPKTVKAIDKHFLNEEFGQTDYTNLRILAIDEIAVKKGHNYMTVVLDYTTGRVVWMGEGRNADTLDAFFDPMTDEQKQAIQAVAMDMWEAYINRVKHHCPQAKIVFDLFHVVKAFGDVIDEVRRDEVRQAETDEDKTYLKGSRYLLLKNRKNLKPEQRVQLRELLAANERLAAVYQLKDQLKMIYRYKRPYAAKRALDQWCTMAKEVDHPAMDRFIGRLRFFEYGILNHCNYPIGTSPLEGVNNKIKVIKRKAYGFHDPEYFALKVKQALPGKNQTP